MKPILSIIVPIYMVEPYLRACLDSILRQKFTNYELILVNDGSPDNCGKICDEYASKNNRIIVIHKENGGVSSARNAGLDVAQGDYITFVDPDDELDETYEKNIEYLIPDTSIDVLQYPTLCMEIGTLMNPSVSQYIRGNEIGHLWFKNEIVNYSVSNKIFKRFLFDNFRFPVKEILEDMCCAVEISEKAKCLYISNWGLYKYKKRESSIMNSTKKSHMLTCSLKNHIKRYLLLNKHEDNSYSGIEVFTRCVDICRRITKEYPEIDINQQIYILNKKRPNFLRVWYYIKSGRKYSLKRILGLILVAFMGVKLVIFFSMK